MNRQKEMMTQQMMMTNLMMVLTRIRFFVVSSSLREGPSRVQTENWSQFPLKNHFINDIFYTLDDFFRFREGSSQR